MTKSHLLHKTALVSILAMSFVGTEAYAFGTKLPGNSDQSSQSPTPTPKPTPKPTPVPTPAPTTPTSPSTSGSSVRPLWEAASADGKEWTAHVIHQLDTLGKDLMDAEPADYATFCPKYRSLNYNDKKEFWAYLISAMTRYESNFKPATQYKEDFNDNTGSAVISRGLLQISIESSKSYGCGFTKAEQLHDPKDNLSCGIRILDRWLGRDQRFAGKVSGGWKGGARYWSVLRSTSGSYPKIIALTAKHPLCK